MSLRFWVADNSRCVKFVSLASGVTSLTIHKPKVVKFANPKEGKIPPVFKVVKFGSPASGVRSVRLLPLWDVEMNSVKLVSPASGVKSSGLISARLSKYKCVKFANPASGVKSMGVKSLL